jgi:uncharacterized protein (DUF736 family)
MRPLTVDPGRIVLFRERNKSNDKAPDLRGACNIDGIQYEIALWQREAKSGVKYLSGEVKLLRAQATHAARPADDADPFDERFDEPASRVDDDALRQQADRSFSDATKSRRW